ncbi:MAG: cobalamin biosynthesis protein [Lachnospiraceae bacterium]|nr:cobalamin biosynthesis protein [Lachnospiraceae bacterium]
MDVNIYFFTNTGENTANEVSSLLKGQTFRGDDINVCLCGKEKLTEEVFKAKDALIFIGASGIAIRRIAPFAENKLHDPAVISIDETKQFVIPLLSGHVGGANAFAKKLAELLHAIPVVTTATDTEGVFSVDEFAAANGLLIRKKDTIKEIAGRMLKKTPVNISVSDDVIISSESSDLDKCVLHLLVRPYVVGMGCKKDTPFEDVEELFLETLKEQGIDPGNVCALSSIDVKKDEKAFKLLAEKYALETRFYTAEELQSVEGEFEESEFVAKTVGVGSVSERAAKRCGGAGKMLVKKKTGKGCTISVFEKYRRVTFDYANV